MYVCVLEKKTEFLILVSFIQVGIATEGRAAGERSRCSALSTGVMLL